MNDWNIQSRAHVCQACEKPFADDDHCHTLLLEERRDYRRMDVCQQCWETQYSEGAADRKGFISHWQGIYHAPPPAPPEPIQRETAETLLRKLIEGGETKDGPVCYILAVMLERKRLLKVKEQTQREGMRIFIYEQPKTGDIFTITDPNLRMDQLEQVQRDISQLLSPPSAAPDSPAPAAATAESSSPETSSPVGAEKNATGAD